MYLLKINIILLLLLPFYVQTQSTVESYTDSIRLYKTSANNTVLHWINEVENIIKKTHHLDTPAIYEFYKTLGAHYFSMKNYKSCAEAYQKSISYQPQYLSNDQQSAHCDIFNHLGISYILTNHKRKGIDYFKKCIHCDLQVKGKATPSVLRKYRNLARACILSGEYEEAVETCNKVLPLLEKLDPSNKKQAFRTNILAARAMLHLPTTDSAQKYLLAAERILNNNPDSFNEHDRVFLYKAMLRNYHLNEDTASVKQAFQKYAQANKSRLEHTNDISAHIDYHFISALYLYRYFDLQKANLHIDTLMNLQCRKDKNDKVIVSAIRRPADIMTHLQVKIRINFNLWNKTQDSSYLKEAIRAAYLGFEILDYYRRTLNDPSSRLEYVEYEYELYDDCFELFYEACQQHLISLNDFWHISEKARAIHISEQTNLRSLEDSYIGLDSLLVSEENLLTDSIYLLSKQLVEQEDEGKSQEISSRITNLQLKLYQLQDKMAALHPQYQQKRTAGRIPSIASIKQKLSGDQVLIEYIMAKSPLNESDLLITFVIEKDKATTFRKETKGLPETIKEYFQLIRKPPLSYDNKSNMLADFKRIDSLGEILRTTLLPDSLLDNYNQWVIIPHKEIFYLPFSALPGENFELENINDWNDYKFISEQHTMQLAFSAQWWLNTASTKNNIQRNGKSLFVHSETSNVGHQDFHDKDQSLVIIQDRKTLLDSLSKQSYKMIYFAAHAEFDNKTQNGAIYIENDHPFTFHDILDLNLENSKVILAACETQIGEESRAEGLMGFAYNFAWAGAKAVSGTLWKVPDQQSSQLLSNCIENNDKLSVTLAESKRKYLKSQKGMNRHPYYWAGVVTFDTFTDPVSANDYLYYVLIAIILLVGMLWVYIKK